VARTRGFGSIPHASRGRRPLSSRDPLPGRTPAVRLALGLTAISALGMYHTHSAGAQDSIPPSTIQPDSLPPLTLETEPTPLTEGTIGWLRVRSGGRGTVTGGQVVGEPLHFVQSDVGDYRALVGVPLEGDDSLRVAIFLTRNEQVDTVTIPIAIRRGDYPREQIAVAPAFVRPDSATSARIQAEFARSRQVSRRAQETPRLWRGAFRLPRHSRITSSFGSARVYNGEVKSRHLGTDFAGAIGAPVRASGRGVVALVGNFYLAGRAIYIDHGGGLVTAYFHLSRADVAEGDTVVRGQRIGRIGQSGRVTGPHLHWVARYGAISLDPMSLLQLEKAGQATKAARPSAKKGHSSHPEPFDSAPGKLR
jgi:murein DD-endopeptidase MepM/ murein hydrolase activator NlpD